MYFALGNSFSSHLSAKGKLLYSFAIKLSIFLAVMSLTALSCPICICPTAFLQTPCLKFPLVAKGRLLLSALHIIPCFVTVIKIRMLMPACRLNLSIPCPERLRIDIKPLLPIAFSIAFPMSQSFVPACIMESRHSMQLLRSSYQLLVISPLFLRSLQHSRQHGLQHLSSECLFQ